MEIIQGDFQNGMASKKQNLPRPRSIDRLNRVVIPPEVLEKLGLQPGDFVIVTLEGNKACIVPVDWKERADLA